MAHHPELGRSEGGAVLAVHVQPGAGRTDVVGRYGDALKLRVAAPPTGNRANDAVVELVSKEFNLNRAKLTRFANGSTRSRCRSGSARATHEVVVRARRSERDPVSTWPLKRLGSSACGYGRIHGNQRGSHRRRAAS